MSEIRVSDTPIFEQLKQELAHRGIVYERLLAPKLRPAKLEFNAFEKPDVEETPTMAFTRVDPETTVKPLWGIEDEE